MPSPSPARALLALAPGLAALVFVGFFEPEEDATETVHLALGLVQGFAGAYLSACVLAAGRPGLLPRIALAGWTTSVTALAIYAAFPEPPAPVSPHGNWRAEADGHTDRAWADSYYREFKDSLPMHWQPYVYWRRQAFEGEHITIDGEGRRRTHRPERLGEGAPRIFVLGGSTIWGTGADDGETIPSWLSRRLEAEGLPSEVVNFGESGYVSTQCFVHLLLELRRGNVPDLVVCYDGANEVASARQSGEPGIPLNESRRRQDFLLGEAPKPPAAAELSDDQLARETLDLYFGNLRALKALADGFGFELLCFWQPLAYLHKPLTAYEEEAAGHAELADMTARIYGLLDERSKPSWFVDLQRVFADRREPRYVDFCHLVGTGNAEIVDAMLPRVLAAIRGR
jgi:hypothetical protein